MFEIIIFLCIFWKKNENLEVIIYLQRFSILFCATTCFSYHICSFCLEISREPKGDRDLTKVEFDKIYPYDCSQLSARRFLKPKLSKTYAGHLLTHCLNAGNKTVCENIPRKSSPTEKKYFIFLCYKMN